MATDSGRHYAWAAALAIGVYALLSVGDGTLLMSPLEPARMGVPSGVLGWARAIDGLVCLLLLPGLFVALSLPRNEAADSATLLLEAFGLSTIALIVNLTALKLATVTVLPIHLLGMGAVEAALAIGLARLRGHSWGAVQRPSRQTCLGLLIVAGLVLYLGVTHLGYAARELGDYWYSAEIETYQPGSVPESLEAVGIRIHRGPGWEALPAEGRPLYRKLEVVGSESITIRALRFQTLSIRYLFSGPVGSSLTIDCDDLQGRGTIERAPLEQVAEGPTLRYLDRGIVLVSVTLPIRQKRTCVLTPTLKAGETGTLVALTGWPLDGLPDLKAYQNWSQVHYYQILNIAENLDWARKALGDQWVTLNQPPLWSYVFAAILVFVGNGMWAVNLFFFLLVGLLVVISMQVVFSEHGEVAWYLWLPLCLLGVSHARIIIGSGSTNFPDNLYALGVVGMLLALVQGRRGLYAGAGLMTPLLRYSGAAFGLILPAVMLWSHPGRRRITVRAVVAWMAVIGALCLAFFLTGAVTGQLEHWFEILYFETFPEHFHGDYRLEALLERPVEFYRLLLEYSGFIPILLLLARGRLARMAALSALLYSLLLCFIDHFPSHYFVPLLYLLGIAVTASLAAQKVWLQGVGVLLACVGLIYGLSLPL